MINHKNCGGEVVFGPFGSARMCAAVCMRCKRSLKEEEIIAIPKTLEAL